MSGGGFGFLLPSASSYLYDVIIAWQDGDSDRCYAPALAGWAHERCGSITRHFLAYTSVSTAVGQTQLDGPNNRSKQMTLLPYSTRRCYRTVRELTNTKKSQLSICRKHIDQEHHFRTHEHGIPYTRRTASDDKTTAAFLCVSNSGTDLDFTWPTASFHPTIKVGSGSTSIGQAE